MSAVGLFLSDPVTFLENNVIVVGWEGHGRDKLTGETVEMTFVQKGAQHGIAKKLGRDLGLYFIVPKGAVASMPGVTADPRTFNVYFCDYQQNNTFGITVSNRADYMFTATMDGCTLGIGCAAPDGARLVYHANVGGNEDKQRTVLGLTMGASLQSTFGPSNYRMEYGLGVLKSTTLGIRSRTTSQWSFYSQVYFEDVEITPRRYYLREVKDIG